jgi:pyroglutamyl-peptidase
VFPGIPGIQIERVAINCLDFQFPDVGGHRWNGVPVEPDAPDAYFASVPVKAMVKAVRDVGVPARISNSASTYKCNQTMYVLLHAAALAPAGPRAGFVHLPDLPQHVASPPAWTPSMALETILTGVRAAIEAAVKLEADVEAFVEAWEF